MDEINSQIEDFYSYFRRQASVILGLKSVPKDAAGVSPADYQIPFYQKILLVTALDTLAGGPDNLFVWAAKPQEVYFENSMYTPN